MGDRELGPQPLLDESLWYHGSGLGTPALPVPPGDASECLEDRAGNEEPLRSGISPEATGRDHDPVLFAAGGRRAGRSPTC